MKTLENVHELSITRATPILNKLNAKSWGTKFHFYSRDNELSLIDSGELNTTLKSQVYTETDGHLVIVFMLLYKSDILMVQRMKDFLHHQEFLEMIYVMKKHWEEDAKVRGLKGVIFQATDYFHPEWVESFQEKFPLKKEDEMNQKIMQAQINNKREIFYADYSDEFQKKSLIFNERVVQVFDSVVAEEPLLATLGDSVISLYDDGLDFYFTSKIVQIEIIGWEEAIHEERYVKLTYDSQVVKLPLRKEDILKHFQQFKEEQRLVNLIDVPKISYAAVVYNLLNYGSSNEESILSKGYAYLETFGDWEFIETEMAQVQKNILMQGHQIIMSRRNDLENTWMLLHKYQTKNYYYYFVIEYAGMDSLESTSLQDFKIFCSTEEKNEKVKEYCINKLIKNIDI